MIASLNTNSSTNKPHCQVPNKTSDNQAQILAGKEAQQSSEIKADFQASRFSFERFRLDTNNECGFRGEGKNLSIPLSSHTKAFTHCQWGSETPTEAMGFYRSRGVVVGGNPSATLLHTLLLAKPMRMCVSFSEAELLHLYRTPHNSTFLDSEQIQANELKQANYTVSEPDTLAKKKPQTEKLEAEICRQQ